MSNRVLNFESLVIKIEAPLYHRSFLLWSLGQKSTARKVEGVSSTCRYSLSAAAAVGYLEHIRLDLTADLPWKGENLAYASSSLPFVG